MKTSIGSDQVSAASSAATSTAAASSHEATKCVCTTACPPCPGRCGCFFQATETAWIGVGGVLASLGLLVAAGLLIWRRRLGNFFASLPS